MRARCCCCVLQRSHTISSSRWAENQKLILAAKAAGKPKPDIKRYVCALPLHCATTHPTQPVGPRPAHVVKLTEAVEYRPVPYEILA